MLQEVWPLCGPGAANLTSRSGCVTGSGWRSISLKSEEIAAFAPMPSASERIATTVTNGVRNRVRSDTLIFRMAYLGDGERSSSGHHASTVGQGGRFASITEQYFRGCTKNDG